MSIAVLGVGGTISAVGAVAGAGASIYGASQAGSGGAAPPMLTPKQSLLSYIKGLEGGLPKLFGLESQYRSQFGNLNQGDQKQYLEFLLGLGGSTSAAAGQQLQAARQRDYQNMLGNTGSVNSILEAMNPGGRTAVNMANVMAQQAYDRAQGPLSFEERRGADQASRESFAARGRINDNSSIISEFLGREDVKAGKRAEAQQLGNNAFALNQQWTSPALSLLMGVPAEMALGQDYLGRSAGAVGANVPQLINPDAGFNLGAQHNANLASYQSAQAAQAAGQANMWGQVGGSLIGLAGDIYKNR